MRTRIFAWDRSGFGADSGDEPCAAQRADELPAQDPEEGPTAHDRVQGLERVNVGEGQDVVLEPRLRPQSRNRGRGDDQDDGRRRERGDVCGHDYL